jgi:glucose-1-phosphate thymidylyltransferase
VIGADFIGDSPVALVLGDNLFFGHGLTGVLADANSSRGRATIFTYRVKNPERYGVVQLADDGSVSRIVEKPLNPPSHLAVTGLYFYPVGVADVARQIGPSARGELEITAVNNWYLERGLLQMKVLHRGFAWLDTGTHEALHQAASFVQTVQERQGLLVASPDEIAWRLGYIDAQALLVTAKALGASDYAVYLENLVAEAGNGSNHVD